MAPTKPLPVTLISDATGSVGERAVQGIVPQFPPDTVQLSTMGA